MNDVPSGASDDVTNQGLSPVDFYPFCQVPVWIVLLEIPVKARYLVDIVASHMNTSTGTVDAWPGVAVLADLLQLKERQTQYLINDLINAGAIDVVPMYVDWQTGERTEEPETDGRGNAQTSNGYRVCYTPPDGQLYSGPISMAEYYDARRRKPRGLIKKRIDEERRRRGRVRTSRRVQSSAPPAEQEERETPQVEAGAEECRDGGAPECADGVQASAPEGDQGGAHKEQDRQRAGRREGTARPPAREPRGPERRPGRAESAGERLLRSLQVGEAVSEQTVRQCREAADALLATWTWDELKAHLEVEAGGGAPRSRMAVLTAVVQRTAPRTPPPPSDGPARPKACATCLKWHPEADVQVRMRMVMDALTGEPVVDATTGRPLKCPACHPDAAGGEER